MSVLRVNYRKTGGVAGVTDLAKGMANGITGSAGANAGGLIYIPSLNGATYSNTLFAQSAYGLMSAYYGSTVYNSGYALQPIQVYPISFSTIAAGSMNLVALSMRPSGSLITFKPMVSQTAVASLSTVIYGLLALVISGP